MPDIPRTTTAGTARAPSRTPPPAAARSTAPRSPCCRSPTWQIIHGPIASARSSWDNRGTRSSGRTTFPLGLTTDLTEPDVIMGRGERRLFHAIKQAIDAHAPAAVFV